MMGKKYKCMRLSAVALGISLGLVSGLFMMLFAMAAWRWGYGTSMMTQYTSMLPGFDATLTGSFIGLAWGFLEGFIVGVIWAWIYNLCLCCCRCCCKSCSDTTDCSKPKMG